MSWPYAYTPAIWPSVLTVLLLVALSVYAWQRRGVPGALVFAVVCLIAAPWAAGSVMELAAVDVECKIFWLKFQGAWQLPAATASACFVLEYAWPGRWLTRRNLALVSIPPLLVLAMILTDDLHHLMWRGFAYNGTVIPLRGLGNWMFVAYAYGLGILNLVVFAWLFVRSPQHRWPVAIMLTGQVVARALYLLEAARALPPALPIDVPPIVFEYVMYAIALFGFRIFDPIPLARQQVIAQMREGVLVLDPQGRVTSLNPAAQAILGLPDRRARGRLIQELLPSYSDAGDGGVGESEISLPQEHSRKDTPGTTPGLRGTVRDGEGTGPETRHYLLETSALRDWRGLQVGRLLLLHDVTEQKQAQAQLLAQRWAQATLQERELLAQELHDGLAQNLGFLNLQAQAAQDSLDRLAQVALEVLGDTRELIGNLLTISLPSEGFCSTLRHVVTRFEEQNGLHVSLDIEHEAEAGCDPSVLPPAFGVQLLRIVQEALANVRKHAGGPTQISVRLRAEAGQMQLTIADNGAGFDPAQTGGDGRRFGLQVMRQRAERIGGQFAVHSAPGQGTWVEVCVPLGEDAEREDAGTRGRGDAEREDAGTRRRGDTEMGDIRDCDSQA
jgi:PAS domain S-box-containing protein